MISGPVKDKKISIDQAYLEPLIPIIEDNSQSKIMVIKGKYKGKLASVSKLDQEQNYGIVVLDEYDNEFLKLGLD